MTLLILALIAFPVVLFCEIRTSTTEDLQQMQGEVAVIESEITDLQAQIKFIESDDAIYTADLQEQIDLLQKRIAELEAMPTPEPTQAINRNMDGGLCMEYKGKFTIVAYYKGGNGLVTATGVKCKEGRTIAVDPKVIPYGTYVYIEDVGIRVAEDCGGFRDMTIDIYMKTESACYDLGKQTKRVWIIK
jgi:3D (Asp-Asp-Asp) domain-containing protein